MIQGIHHITALAGDPRRNAEFYSDTLGLRMVKRTVNFDDPGTWHLYFGDRLGRPGTLMTFFPWPGARRGSRGVGQATSASFSVPAVALEFWQRRLESEGVLMSDPEERFGDPMLRFYDPDGLELELVGDAGAESESGWDTEAIPREASIRGLHGITLRQRDAEASARFLTAELGFDLEKEDRGRQRFRIPGEGFGRWVDIVSDRHGPHGTIAAGSIHHVAWRVEDDNSQEEWRRRLVEGGAHVSPVMDRQYFHSIYFREPGGVLYEIATDPPGFTIDESPEALGEALRLPPWLESQRESIAARLPTLEDRPVEEMV